MPDFVANMDIVATPLTRASEKIIGQKIIDLK
jgi:hypothetical protein